MAVYPSYEITGLSRFRFWCQKVLPAVYDDSLTYYELLCKVIDKLNELIEKDNEQSDVINELNTFVVDLYNYIHNLPLDEAVSNKIDAMIEDGSFEAIVGDYIQANLFDDICYMHKVGILPYERTGRGYPTMQGGCLSEANNFIQYQIKSNTDENRVSVCSLATGQTLRTTVGRFGHGNSVAYHDGKIYITGGAADEYSDSIHVLDYDTLEVLDRIEGTSYYGLQYMDSIDSWVAMNDVWGEIHDTEQKLYILNDDFSIKEEKDYSNFNVGKSSAGMGVVGDLICILTLEPSNILLFDRNLNYIRSIELDRNIDFMHFASEIEWIDGDKENVYFGVRLFGRANYNAGNHLIAKSSLVSSFQGGSPTLSTVSREFTETVYVDEPSNWAWYETGTQENPFNNPYLAANAAQIRELSRIYINFKAATTYDFELGFEDCQPKVHMRDNGNHTAQELVRFTGALFVQNAEIASSNIQFGTNVSEGEYRIIGGDDAKITLLSTRYGTVTPILINMSRTSILQLGGDEADFNFIGSSLKQPVTFGNRANVVGLLYDAKPENSIDSNYFKGLQNFTQSLTNNDTGTYTVWLPTAIPTPWFGITLNGTTGGAYSGKTAYCEMDIGERTASGAPVYFPNNPELVGGIIASTATGSDSNWAGATFTLKVYDTSNNNQDVTNQWVMKYIRMNA